MIKLWLTLLFISLLFYDVNAQLVINEASNRNYSQITDEDGDNEDWIEIYNTTNRSVNLNGWALSDSRKEPSMWKFAPSPVSANGFVLIHASEKDRNEFAESLNWESAVLPQNDFQYIIPTATTSDSWNQVDFNATGWKTGKAGFGYGDDDDQTTVPTETTVIFIRKEFNISDPSLIQAAKFHIDYDDAFVAYLNGVEIVRANVNGLPRWNSLAIDNHEAVMYNGGTPDEFDFERDQLSAILKQGKNVLAIAAVNLSASSTDLSLIPFLSFGLSDDNTMFQPVPDWFIQSAPGNLHSNFKLKSSGEKIYLSKAGVIIDSLDVDHLQRDQSIGRVTNGAAETGIFMKATPGESNNTSQAYTKGFSAKPKLSMPAGFYQSSVEVAITTADPNAEIHYTIDGSEPTETSPKYNTKLKISSTKSIRVRSFTPNLLPSEITTATYFINERNYTIPVLSVVTNSSYIFGNEGIFTRWNDTFDVPAYMEFFDKDKKLAFHQLSGMQIDGGAGGSRSQAQHSFRMEPGNGTLGDGDLNYKLMERRPNRTNFPSFYVRNGSNQYLRLPYKDGLEVTALGRNTYTYYSAYQPIAVYINAEFFGIYELREKINDDYLVDNYQMNIDSLDFLGVSYFKGQKLEALRGSILPFLDDYKNFLAMDPKDADYLQRVDKFLDLKSYTDYIIAESWVGNNDWPQNNIKLFRCSSTGFRWQWAINDLEWALDPNSWTTSSFDHIQYMLGHGTGNYYTAFWFNMMKNEEYKAYFVNRFADLMNTSYDFSVVGPLENEMFNELNAEMDAEFKRWGGTNVSSQMTRFYNDHETFRSELSKRSSFVRDDLQDHFNLLRKVNVTLDVEPKGAGSIQISTITPTNYPWDGIYFGNVEIELKAIPNMGYEFVNWDPNAFISDISQALISGKFKSNNITFRANFRETNSVSNGVVISEINYKSGTDEKLPDWIELCNYTDSTVNLNGWSFTDSDTSHVFRINQDLILSPRERAVFSNDVYLFNVEYPGVDVFPVEFDFGLGVPSDELHLFNNSKEKVFSVNYSDNYPWALSNDQSGRTLELRTPAGDFSQAGSWFRGCIGGSPGTSYQFCEEAQPVNVPTVELNSMDMNVYPNPAHHFIEVEFNLDHQVDFCKVKIFNLMGSEIRSEDMGNLTSGKYQVNFDLTSVQGQLLLVKLETNRGQKLMKVLKVE